MTFEFKFRRCKPQSFQTGTGQNDGVPVAFDKFSQTSWHISSQRDDLRLWIHGARLPLSPRASCRDDCERRKGGALSQQQIFDTGTWQNSRNHQRAIHFARDIFCAVNSDIDPFLD